MSIKKDNLYSNSMLDIIDNIVEVVLNSYFYWVNDYQMKEDLKQEGYLKAYELLKTGNYDPNQNLRNYLFTGVRNAMTNLNYHYSKEKHTSYELYNDNIEDGLFDPNYIISSSSFECYDIDTETVKKLCKLFNKSSYVGNVLAYFKSIGLETEEGYTIDNEAIPCIVKAIIVEYMWSI